MIIMKKLSIVLIVFATFLLNSCAQIGIKAPANEIQAIQLLSPIFPPIVGIDELVLRVIDPQTGSPISDAYLSVRGQATAVQTVPILSSSKAGTNGEYIIPFEWTAGGDWVVTVSALLPDGSSIEKTFDVAVDGDEVICAPTTPQ
jgi:hypothetical protein